MWSRNAEILTFSAGTASTTAPTDHTATNTPAMLYQYIEVTGSCGAYWDGGECVNLRSGPGTTFAGVIQLRNGMVLKVASTTITDGRTWYKVGFDGDIRYPERVKNGWWVAGDFVRVFYDRGPVATSSRDTTTEKHIVIDITTETLSAYDGNTLFMTGPISTGLKLTPTPLGKFWVQRKMPDSYMQGPIPGVSDQYYDLQGYRGTCTSPATLPWKTTRGSRSFGQDVLQLTQTFLQSRLAIHNCLLQILRPSLPARDGHFRRLSARRLNRCR